MLRIPNLDNVKCEAMIYCAHLETSDKRISKWLDSQKLLVAKSTKSHVLLFTNNGHFHMEVHSDAYLDKSSEPPPSPPDKLADIKKAFKRVSKATAEISITAQFELHSSNFPDFIKSTLVSTKAGGVELRTSGGRIDVTGAPIHRISWYSRKGQEAITVDVARRFTGAISDSGLVDALDICAKAFNAIILGKKSDG